MFSNHFITNFPQNVPVKNFWKTINNWQRHRQKFAAYFYGHPVVLTSKRTCWYLFWGKIVILREMRGYLTLGSL